MISKHNVVDMPDDIGDYLENRRKKMGWSQAQLAEKAGEGWDQAKVCKLETCVRLPSADDMEVLARLLEAPLVKLVRLRAKSELKEPANPRKKAA
jgi:transcriptional regulator with XRE-family HTH domain